MGNIIYTQKTLICTVFALKNPMFLTAPTIHELEALELPALLDMLVRQTSIYSQLEATEGLSERTLSSRDLINNIQAAIKLKVNAVKSQQETVSIQPLQQENTSTVDRVS